MSHEIINIHDIRLLVDSFYSKVREDELLGPVFRDRIKDHWPEHLEKITRFWQTVLLEEPAYSGSPFAPHANLPIEMVHFDRWLSLFYKTLDEHFSGKKAEEAKTKAAKMAEMFYHKISYHRENPGKLIL